MLWVALFSLCGPRNASQQKTGSVSVFSSSRAQIKCRERLRQHGGGLEVWAEGDAAVRGRFFQMSPPPDE